MIHNCDEKTDKAHGEIFDENAIDFDIMSKTKTYVKCGL